jgi:mono/diheme cytochrome c family protein
MYQCWTGNKGCKPIYLSQKGSVNCEIIPYSEQVVKEKAFMKKVRACIFFCVFVLAVCCALVLSGKFLVTAAAEAAEGSPSKSVAKPSGATEQKEGSALLPAFAGRARVPASGKQGPPGKASKMTGSRKIGAGLFVTYCQSCHGPEGTGKIPNPGSDDGIVPPLNPIDPVLSDKRAPVFARKIDRYMQHGSLPDGSDPALFMPDWGDSKTLSQKEIASVEAYIMYINGVVRRR